MPFFANASKLLMISTEHNVHTITKSMCGTPNGVSFCFSCLSLVLSEKHTIVPSRKHMIKLSRKHIIVLSRKHTIVLSRKHIKVLCRKHIIVLCRKHIIIVLSRKHSSVAGVWKEPRLFPSKTFKFTGVRLQLRRKWIYQKQHEFCSWSARPQNEVIF